MPHSILVKFPEIRSRGVHTLFSFSANSTEMRLFFYFTYLVIHVISHEYRRRASNPCSKKRKCNHEKNKLAYVPPRELKIRSILL